ncbi:hypothetical protein KSC_005930 [Ktedonobacter sp. SOSP1-52]|uniref:hypothetical protein n=1 Tax=Ktedonobacter sp. SOSP1-52 TaxID=2778366 RepID=UPI00191510EC|nr:hypothetical protein [Ktedonobacter sp. SOSP1-52]GHO61701.1 hypothetical protein KSC_005930 [Ktedonobacter sp. SOSP1-52]
MNPEPRPRDQQALTIGSPPGPSSILQERHLPEEHLLLTCSPLLDTLAMESIATSLVGMLLAQGRRSYQVVDGRVDHQTHQIYGICQEIDGSTLVALLRQVAVMPQWIRQNKEGMG